MPQPWRFAPLVDAILAASILQEATAKSPIPSLTVRNAAVKTCC